MNEKLFLQQIDLIRRKTESRSRKCLLNDCDNKAIKSHVLQKNGILSEMSVNNHLFQFGNASPFNIPIPNKRLFELPQIGVNDAFTFKGFCAEHDSSLFHSIENIPFDITKPASIALFSYRTLCQEIRRKEIASEITKQLISYNSTNPMIDLIINLHDGQIAGLKNLNFFKNEFESERDLKNDNYLYKICEIPRTEICISAPLQIYDGNNVFSDADRSFGEDGSPFVTSILNIFPFKEKSYVMLALHKKYWCFWSDELFNEFDKSNGNEHFKLLSDLISTRVEFWCMSPNLKAKIDKVKLDKLIKIWSNEVLNFDADIPNNFNLFEK